MIQSLRDHPCFWPNILAFARNQHL